MIPKTIHYCWFGGNPKPKSVIKCIKSWKKKCPGYEIIEWNESNYNVTQNRYMKEAYDEKKWAFVSDYARLDIIYRHGGVYLDTDVELIKPLDPFLDCIAFFGFQFDNTINLGLGFGTEPENKLIKSLLEIYNSISFYNADRSLNLMPITDLLAPVFQNYGFELNNCLQNIKGIIVYPTDYFDPVDHSTGFIFKSKKNVSIHHYNASWYPEYKKIQRRIMRRNGRIFYIRTIPNRLLMKLMGKRRYENLKQIIKYRKNNEKQ